VLPDGRVYVCGGEYGTGGSTGEVYNPKTNTWTPTPGPFPNVISDANSEILPNGNVLQASVDESGENLNYLWNPTTNTYTAGPNCKRIDNEAVWVKLPDSSILFLDNYGLTSERYMPKTNTWINDASAPVNLYDPYGSEAGAGFTLPDGRVFFIGSTPNTLYYTPSGTTAPGTWAAGPAIPGSYGAADAPSAMMVNGKILLTVSPTPTSADHFPSPTQYYEFDYTTNTFTLLAAPGGGTSTNNSCYIGNMLDLPDGTVLFVNQNSDVYYQYTPSGAPLAAGKPAIAAVSRVNCDTFRVTGTMFNGITEGAAYGDDWQMETNFPIVRLTSGANTYYATTYNWNRIGAVMTGTLPDTAIFALPAGLAAGTYSVTVVANGNPSDPFTINTSLTILPATSSICKGAMTTLSDSATIGAWSSANNAIASVDPATGIVSGTGAGTTTISYSIGACHSVATVTVTPLPAAIAGSAIVCIGSSTMLSDGVAGGTWSSSATAVATINSAGSLSGSSVGSTIIAYTLPTGCAITATATVNPLPAATISPVGATTFCAPGSVLLNGNTGTGITYQWQGASGPITGATSASFTATTADNYSLVTTLNSCSATSAPVAVITNGVSAGVLSGASAVCVSHFVTLVNTVAGGTWSVDNTAMATVDASGNVTGVAAGSVIVSYSVTNACGTAVATLPLPVNIPAGITPVTGPGTVCVGGFTSLNDVTSGGVWSSTNAGIAMVNASGMVTGVATGSIAISYTVTNAAGCVTAATATILVAAPPAPAIITPAGPTAFCTGGYVFLNTVTGTGVSSQWQNGGVDIIGATSPNYLATTTGNYTLVITNSSGCQSTSAPVTVTVNPGTLVVPSVSISGDHGFVLCNTSSPETFTASPVGGGSSPVYEWRVNGSVVGTAATYNYTPANGDVIMAKVTSNAACAFPDTANTSATIAISAMVTPMVSIAANPGLVLCSGNIDTLAAVPVYGGAAPVYIWQKNGVNVATGAQYIYAPANGDVIVAVMSSNFPCVSAALASSTAVMQVTASIDNTLSVSVYRSVITAGETDTFYAVAPNAGTSPVVQWYKNGAAIAGANQFKYYTNTLVNTDVITCGVTSSDLCAAPGTVMSPGIRVGVVPEGVQQISDNGSNFTLQPNPNKGVFTINGTISSKTDDKVNIIITDVLGQTVYNKTAITHNGVLTAQVTLDGSLASGTYLVSITSGNAHAVFHVVLDK
jgi:hypothetical protein